MLDIHGLIHPARVIRYEIAFHPHARVSILYHCLQEVALLSRSAIEEARRHLPGFPAAEHPPRPTRRTPEGRFQYVPGAWTAATRASVVTERNQDHLDTPRRVHRQARPTGVALWVPPSERAVGSWSSWYPSSEWQLTTDQQTEAARHSREPCPQVQPGGWEHQDTSLAQREEQMQLLWALTDQTVSTPQRAPQRDRVGAPKSSAPSQRKQHKEIGTRHTQRSFRKAPRVRGRPSLRNLPHNLREQSRIRLMETTNSARHYGQERTERNALFNSHLGVSFVLVIASLPVRTGVGIWANNRRLMRNYTYHV